MKKTHKIYLAKSNRSNPNDVSRVRSLLETLDVEVVEFSGGKYSNKPLMGCDFLVVVPDLSEYDFNTHLDDEGSYNYIEQTVPLGKGLHEQIEEFSSKFFNNDNIFIVKNTDDCAIMCSGVEELDIVDFQDYVHYSNLEFTDTTEELDINLKELGVKTKNETVMETKDGYVNLTSDNYSSYGILNWSDDDLLKQITMQVSERENRELTFDSKSNSLTSNKDRRKYLLIKNLRKK